MGLNRRHFLLFVSAGLGTAACGKFPVSTQAPVGTTNLQLPFQPIQGPMPLGFTVANQKVNQASLYAIQTSAPEQQMKDYSTYEVVDDLVLPEDYTYEIVASWGDRVGDSRFGYNNDYLSFIPTTESEGYLVSNFEYISAVPWQQTFEKVIGKKLPFREADVAVRQAIKAIRDDKVPGLNAYALPDNNPTKRMVQEVCKEALIDQGVGVISLRKLSDGRWERTNSDRDRRITGISGLEDGRYLKATGPATLIFQKTKGQGYVDQLGTKVIGTFQNCAGGTTPWGTVLSAEENIQVQVPEPVFADGTSLDPINRPFNITDEELTGLGNVFGLAGNKYGWIVEVDPANPKDYGTKHTWIGRYRHEAVGVRAEAGKKLAFYSGCDRRGGHIYKFVSSGVIKDPKDKANSKLLEDGMLYVAQFNQDGTGKWIPLRPETPVDPTPPTFLTGVMLPLPLRPAGGIFQADDDAQIEEFKQKFKTLADLYVGSNAEKQGAILIDAHYAANAAGATCTARPEDTDIAPDGSLFITFTSGSPSKEDGSPDIRIFRGPKSETGYEFGWIMRLMETDNQPDAMTFKWEMAATGGEPADGGMGFANPDNLAFDPKGNLWMVTDMSTDKLNYQIGANRLEKSGAPIKPSSMRGLYGNNSLWYIPLSGENAGQPYLFGYGPMECEMTGPCFTVDGSTLFMSVQHPGEVYGIRKDMAQEERQFAMRTTSGQEFMQNRKVPLGSNWPSKQANEPPKPSVVAIRRKSVGVALI